MAIGHKESRRPRSRAFQPSIDGRLETRVLLSGLQIQAQTAAGGQAVVITGIGGNQFFVSVTQGNIRATPASNGRVNLIASGTTSNTYLEINQILPTHSFNSAHTYRASLASASGILDIASLKVTSGFINSIEGYHDAVLSGPLTVPGPATVNRIAFTSIRPGGSIAVGGTLQTLDIFNNATFSGSSGLSVGLDLDWFDTGGNLTFEKGANMTVARDLGPTVQLGKGSGNPGQGFFVNGNLTVTAPSRVTIGRNIDFPGILVNGNLSGASRFSVGGAINGFVTILGTTTA